MPGVNEALASITLATPNDAFRFLHFPQEILLEIIHATHETYVAKEERDEPHPLTNLRL